MARRRLKNTALTRVATWFGQGLLVFVPTIATVLTVWLTLSWLDSLLGIPIPGLGLVLTVLIIILIGFIATNVAGQAVLALFERTIQHLPVVSLVYSSIKDLLGAFVGEKKSFDKPTMVSLDAEGKVKVFGFVTCDRFEDPRLSGFVAIYLPQAYNFAGNVIVVPRERVEHVDAEPAHFMAFIVSGGVSTMTASRTVMDTGGRSPFGTRASQTSLPGTPPDERR
jgi:uncharacterized membrane protein